MGQPPKPVAPASNPRRRVQRYLSLAYALLLSYLSLAPGQRIPEIFDWGTLFSPDKVAHFGAYAVFALLLSTAFTIDKPVKRTATAVFAAAAFGVLMEVLQALAGTGRSFDPVDMVANLIGACLGGLVYLLLRLLINNYLTPVRLPE